MPDSPLSCTTEVMKTPPVDQAAVARITRQNPSQGRGQTIAPQHGEGRRPRALARFDRRLIPGTERGARHAAFPGSQRSWEARSLFVSGFGHSPLARFRRQGQAADVNAGRSRDRHPGRPGRRRRQSVRRGQTRRRRASAPRPAPRRWPRFRRYPAGTGGIIPRPATASTSSWLPNEPVSIRRRRSAGARPRCAMQDLHGGADGALGLLQLTDVVLGQVERHAHAFFALLRAAAVEALVGDQEAAHAVFVQAQASAEGGCALRPGVRSASIDADAAQLVNQVHAAPSRSSPPVARSPRVVRLRLPSG